MRIILVNRYFAPDESATSRMVSSLATMLARSDVNVHVLTGRALHDGSTADLPKRQRVGGAVVHRLWTTRFGRSNLIGRSLDYLTFHLSAFLWLLIASGKQDVCIVCTDPPLISCTVGLATRFSGATLINWVMDLFPEVAIDAGLVRKGSPAGRLAMWLRDWSLRIAARTVVPTGRMAEHLAERGMKPGSLVVIQHWANGGDIRPMPRREVALRREWGFADRFVVGYSGNLGRAHEFDTLLGAAAQLEKDLRIEFLFVGNGYRLAHVKSEVERLKLGNVHFRPLQPRARLAECLAVPDIHFVSLLPEMESSIVPSKFYGIAAAGRPTLFVGDADGEIAGLVRRGRCGVSVKIGDVAGLVEAIRTLAGAPVVIEEMGQNAERLYRENFTEARGLSEWKRLLDLEPAPENQIERMRRPA